MQDKLFKVLLILSAIVIPVIGGGIIYSLTVDASGAFEEFGFWHFIFSDDWVTTAGKESYGALPFITGTLLTTALALLMCIPFSLPVALFTGEYFRGKKIAAVLGTVIDLLAGIPSIIYGLWGFYVLRTVFMHLNLSPQGSGILTAAFVLAIMIVPYAASLSAEFIKMVPSDLKEGAYSFRTAEAGVAEGRFTLSFKRMDADQRHAIYVKSGMGKATVFGVNDGDVVTVVTVDGKVVAVEEAVGSEVTFALAKGAYLFKVAGADGRTTVVKAMVR